MTGVGKIALPLVSLYNDTFPEITGILSFKDASLIPLIE